MTKSTLNQRVAWAILNVKQKTGGLLENLIKKK